MPGIDCQQRQLSQFNIAVAIEIEHAKGKLPIINWLWNEIVAILCVRRLTKQQEKNMKQKTSIKKQNINVHALIWSIHGVPMRSFFSGQFHAIHSLLTLSRVTRKTNCIIIYENKEKPVTGASLLFTFIYWIVIGFVSNVSRGASSEFFISS